MEPMEIERKFLLRTLPDLSTYPCKQIEQAYLCTSPVVRIRKSDDRYTLTYKGSGLMAHTEYNLPLDAASYEHLRAKADGNVITKRRYLIPLPEDQLTIELDLFEGIFEGLCLAEIEFPSEEMAASYPMPAWFAKDVTNDRAYHNSSMSSMSKEEAAALATASRIDMTVS